MFQRYIYYSKVHRAHIFDFDKQFPPSSVQKKKLLLQIPGDSFVTCLNEKIPSIIHVHVLLHPVREVSKKILQKREANQQPQDFNSTGYDQSDIKAQKMWKRYVWIIQSQLSLNTLTRFAFSDWLSICSASSSQACRPATVLLYFSQLQITSSSILRTLRTSKARFFHWAVVSLRNLLTPSASSTENMFQK